MGRKRGLSDVVAAALIAAAANAPTTAYVAYTHHVEETARISADTTKRGADEEAARRARVVETAQARCTAALQFLGDETPNPALKPAETQRLLEDMRGVAERSCGITPMDDLGASRSQQVGHEEKRR